MNQRIITILTAAIVALWTVTAVVRIWQPWPAAAILDSAMPLVIGYWFVTNAATKNGKAATEPAAPTTPTGAAA